MMERGAIWKFVDYVSSARTISVHDFDFKLRSMAYYTPYHPDRDPPVGFVTIS